MLDSMAEPAARMSPAEYLALEREASQKHELNAGKLFAMAGGSYEHNLIAANVVATLSLCLHARPCVVLSSDMKVRAANSLNYHYPDASVVCGQPRFEDAVRDVVLNPVLLVEVLSDSTERYDRGDKFASYRQIETLSDYLLVSSKQMRVEHFSREPDASWRLRVFGAAERISLPALGVEPSVDQFYLKAFEQAST
jgi:Uma2 family endonuclease